MRHKRLRQACVIFLLFANKFSFSQDAVITGRVTFGTDVLQAATVLFGNKMMLTNEKGEFSFSVKPGNYKIMITHAGYKKMEKNVQLDAGVAVRFDFDMTPNGQLGEIVVVGSRSFRHRSNLNTPVPIDVFSSLHLMET